MRELFFYGLMLILFAWDLISYYSGSKYRDFKGTIVSVGVLGTFTGIYVGLQGFNVNNPEDSIPGLLAGLKLAFSTSIAAMVLSLVLTIIQKLFRGGRVEESASGDYLEQIAESIGELCSMTEINNNRLGRTLSKTLQATTEKTREEVLSVLDKVVTNFDEAMVTQFGGNFRRLEEGISQIYLWQAQSMDSITASCEMLEKAVQSIGECAASTKSISESGERIAESYASVAKSHSAIVEASDELGEQAGRFSALLEKQSEFEDALESSGRDLVFHVRNIKEALDEVPGQIRTAITRSAMEAGVEIKASQEELTKKISVDATRLLNMIENALGNFKKQGEDIQEVSLGFVKFSAEHSKALSEQLERYSHVSENLAKRVERVARMVRLEAGRG